MQFQKFVHHVNSLKNDNINDFNNNNKNKRYKYKTN